MQVKFEELKRNFLERIEFIQRNKDNHWGEDSAISKKIIESKRVL